MGMTDPLLSGLSTFAGQTAGVQSGLQQQALSQQMQQFLMALQFQQQQAALSQAMNYGSQYGFAPGGNWMTWGQGGPTAPAAGTPTLAELASQMGLTTTGLQNALATAGVTGQFAQPTPSQYAPGTILGATDASGAYGVVNADGSLTMLGGPALGQLAAQRGTTVQALTSQAAPASFQQMQTLSQGPPTAPAQQTQAAQQQQFAQAAAAAGLTGQFTDPSQSMSYLLSQGKAMNGQAFTDLPPDQQQYWLQWNANNPTAAAQQWARGVNNALQSQGYQNPAGQPQQTLQSINQAAQLSGMYNGAPTEAAREFNASNALAQGQLGQQ